MSTYYCSDGTPVTQSKIDRLYAKSAKAKLAAQVDEHGYSFCEDCGANEMTGPLDVSHQISRKKCKENSMAELVWAAENLRIRCRVCHKKYDKLE